MILTLWNIVTVFPFLKGISLPIFSLILVSSHPPASSPLSYNRAWTLTALPPRIFKMFIMLLPALFRIHVLTDTDNWLALLWLAGRESMPLSPREHGQLFLAWTSMAMALNVFKLIDALLAPVKCSLMVSQRTKEPFRAVVTYWPADIWALRLMLGSLGLMYGL